MTVCHGSSIVTRLSRAKPYQIWTGRGADLYLERQRRHRNRHFLFLLEKTHIFQLSNLVKKGQLITRVEKDRLLIGNNPEQNFSSGWLLIQQNFNDLLRLFGCSKLSPTLRGL